MCRILYARADADYAITDILLPFAELAQRSSEFQGHGWGCAWREGKRWRQYHDIRPIWEEYMDFHMSRDEATRHQKLHESHYSFLDPEEARFITPEIIKNFCIAGHPEEIVEQLRGLEKQGLNAVTFSLPLDKMYRTIEDFSRNVMSKM